MTSRKQPPEPHESRLWKAGYAWNSFQNVVDVCDYILSEKIPFDARIYYPLVVSISVLYARPFKRSKGIARLTEQFVPRKFLKLHEQLILVRDKTAAHVDARGPTYQGLAANSVLLLVRNNGRKVALGTNQVKFNESAISQIRELAGALVERMLKYTQRVASECHVLNDGDYRIDLETGTFRRE